MSRPAGAAALAIAAGLAGFAAHPPVGLWPLVLLPAPLLLAAVALEVADAEDRHVGRAGVFRYGMLAGVVTFAPLISWLITAAGTVGWVALTLIQGVFYGLFALAVRPFVDRPAIVVVAPLAWVGIETVRGTWPLGGFDWGALSYAHTDGSWLLPVARVLGGRGLTLITVLIGAFAFDAGRRIWHETRGLEGPFLDRLRGGLPGAQPAFLGLAAALLLGTLITVEPPAPTGRTLDVLAVQGNDFEDWGDRPGATVDQLVATRMRDLTLEAVTRDGRPELTVWPESSVDRDPYAGGGVSLLPLVEDAAAAVGGDLLLGVNLGGPRPDTFANVALLVDDRGEPQERYDKRHLVPFGEYVPFRSVLGGVGPLRQVPRDAVPGEGPQTLTTGPARIAVAICFETLFPDLVRENVLAGDAELVLATTNDASFGRSAEPAQHLAQSRLRAVETGRWVVHAALSGSSAFVSPEGVIIDATPLFEQATIRRDVPLVAGATPFLVTGDVVGTVGIAAILVLLLHAWHRSRRTGRATPAQRHLDRQEDAP